MLKTPKPIFTLALDSVKQRLTGQDVPLIECVPQSEEEKIEEILSNIR